MLGSDFCMVLGQSENDKRPIKICVNIFNSDSTSASMNYVKEMSEFKTIYPYVVYCKGNTELFFHSLVEPSKITKLSLTECNTP